MNVASRWVVCVSVLPLCLVSGRLWAHRVNIFAAVAGEGAITGQVYFSGGTKPAGATVLLYRDGAECARTTTDADGRFRFTGVSPGDYRVVAELDDGHRASCRIGADQFGGGSGATGPPDVDATPPAAAAEPDGSTPPAAASERLAAQVRALRADIHALERRIRLQDMLGGLGYILGLTGLACLLRRRRG